MFNYYVKSSFGLAVLLMAFSFSSLAQTTTSVRTQADQKGIILAKDLQFVQGKTFNLEYSKDVVFKTTLKVIEADPFNNLPRYIASAFIGSFTSGVPISRSGIADANGMYFMGKLKYFTNNPQLRYDFIGSYGFGNNTQTGGNHSRFVGNLGIHYVPIRIKSSPWLFSQGINFSRGFAYDPLTKTNYPVGITGKYQVVREIGFRAGALYSSLNFNFVPSTVDVRFPSSVTNPGGYLGITYGTVRNLIIGSTNMGMHKNSKYNEVIFDFMYAPTTFNTDYTGAEKPNNFTDLGYRMIVNFIKPAYHRRLSVQVGAEVGKYPGVNTHFVGLHLGLSFADRKKYNADSIANDLQVYVTAKGAANDTDSIMNGSKKPYDFVTKNKKGYYILTTLDSSLIKKPMKMVSTSRQFLVTTETTTRETVGGVVSVNNGTTYARNTTYVRTTTQTRTKTVFYFFGVLGNTNQTVEFKDFNSPAAYRKSMISQYLKAVPAADNYYLDVIKRDRRWRRITTWGTYLALAATAIVYSQEGSNSPMTYAAGITTGAFFVGSFFAPEMGKKEYDKILSIYNKGLSGKAPRSK